MRKKSVLVAVLALFTMAAMPSLVFAKSMFFTTDGSLAQTNPGSPVSLGFPFPTGVAPAGLLETIAPEAFALLPSGTGAEVLGVMTLDQRFDGAVDSSGLPQLNGGGITVTQNSWFNLDSTLLGQIDGVAWGTFELNKGNGNRLAGSYAAKLDGVIVPKAECVTASNPTGLYVAVTDIGDWQVVGSHGSFKKISVGPDREYANFFGVPMDGTLFVHASGCLGIEDASFSVSAANR